MVPQDFLAVSPSRLAWLAWAGLGIVLVYSLTLPIATLPGNGAWLRRFETPEIVPGRVLDQTFTMNRDGLTAIEFALVPVGPPARDISLTLLDVTVAGAERVVAADAIRVHALGDRQSFGFAFDPIAGSRFHTYQLEVSGTDGPSGYALVATKGDRYAGGTMGVNDRARWGDLVFQTFVSPPVGSTWTTLWTRRGESGRASGKLILALLGLNWVAVGFLLRAAIGLAVAGRVPAAAPEQPSPRG